MLVGREANEGWWQADFIEMLTRAGDRDAALRALLALEDDARRTNRLWTRTIAARCRGYLGEDDFEVHFERALSLHRSWPVASRFETARTRLCYGEVLRRRRERTRAREQLRAALEVFEELSAEPWANRARSELVATGERAHKRNVASRRALTPQELQIATVVAGGATNREVAARLFLSEKTVEAHLSSLYRKLEIRSRTDLARLFAERAAAAARRVTRPLSALVVALFAGLSESQQLLQDGVFLGTGSAPGS